MRLAATLYVLALAFCGCGRPIPATYSSGWHRCPGKTTGCLEWENCSRFGCAWAGNPNGPGAADSAKDSSGVNAPDR